MNIGILGTGALAVALGAAWSRGGHEILIGGRSPDNAMAAATRIGGSARAVAPADAVAGRDAVLVAVSMPGLHDILTAAGAAAGSLAGTPLIDPTNAVNTTTGTELPGPSDGRAIAEHVADWAPGAGVVKAFHLLPADQWKGATVPLAGDDEPALRVVSRLVRDVGGRPAVLGPLDQSRQLEAVAGFVIALAGAGLDPHSALLRMPTTTPA